VVIGPKADEHRTIHFSSHEIDHLVRQAISQVAIISFVAPALMSAMNFDRKKI
jgi:hypothetical protein